MVQAVQRSSGVLAPAVVTTQTNDQKTFNTVVDQIKKKQVVPVVPDERPNADTKRPEGDNRSAQQIIVDTPLLANLSEKERNGLKSLVGDYFNDADAAYRATRVLWHVENYDENGNKITRTDDIGNGRIDGFTKSGEAIHGTEAGRLQDVVKYGYGFLKGGGKPAVPRDPPTADTVRPAGDNRSAAQIIADDPLLADLSEKERNGLKSRVGDYFNDADAAYRAVRVLDHVENYDESGKVSDSSGNIGNGRLDGFTNSGEAIHGTEAGRFQDFVKYGYDYLKNYDESITETNLPPRNPALDKDLENAVYDGDEAKAIDLLNKGADPKAKGRTADDISLLAVAASKSHSNTVQAILDHIPKNERKDFVNKKGPDGRTAMHEAASAGDKVAYQYLKDAGGDENLKSKADESPKDLLEANTQLDGIYYGGLDAKSLEDRPDTATDYSDWLLSKIQLSAVKDVAGFDRKDIIAHPEKYSVEQRAKAVVELGQAIQKIHEGQSKGYDTLDPTNGRVNMDLPSTRDNFAKTDAVLKQLNESLKKVDSPEAETWLTNHMQAGADALFKTKPELKQLAADHAKWMTETPEKEGFNQLWDSTTDKTAALAAFASKFDVLNTFGGNGTDPAIKDPMIKLDGTGHKEDVNTLINNDFFNANRMQDLIDGKVPGLNKMSPEEASKFLGSRLPLYGLYGGNTIEMQKALAGMNLKYSIDNTSMDVIWAANGGKSLTVEQYKQILTDLQKQYPDQYKDLDLDLAAGALQKLDATMKAAGYWDMSTILKTGVPKLNGTYDPAKDPNSAKNITAAREDLRNAFKGNIQYAGSVFAGLWLAAHITQTDNGTPVDIAKTAGIALLSLDMGLEGFNRFMRTGSYTPSFPNSTGNPKLSWFEPATGESADAPFLTKFNNGQPIPRTVWDTFNTMGKLSGSAGLFILGGVGIAAGINQIKAGQDAQGAASILLGIANLGAGGSLGADASMGLYNIGRFFGWWGKPAITGKLPVPVEFANKAYIGGMARIAAMFAPWSFGFNVAGLAATLGFAFADIINVTVYENPWRDDLHKQLDPYGVNGRWNGY